MPGSVRVDLELAAARRVEDLGGGNDRRRVRPVEHEVMVVPAAERDLLVAGVTDPGADRLRLREVERRSGHRVDRARRDQGRVHGRVVVGVQPEHVVVDIARALTGEVPVAVVRQVEHRRLVRRGVVVDPQLVVLRERVRHVDAQRAGIALLAIRARVVQLQADTAVARRDHRRRPHLVVEPFDAAVERVRRVVDRQVVRHPVERERAVRDPVPVAADDRRRSTGRLPGTGCSWRRSPRGSGTRGRRSPTLPRRSGTHSSWTMPPYVRILTTIPLPLSRV